MKSLALKLIRKAASYTGGATTGLAFTAFSTGATTPVGIGLLGLVGLCLLVETATESQESSEQIDRIETWLEELVRRHGRLDMAVKAIAQQRESHELVTSANAATLSSIMEATEEETTLLLQHNAEADSLLEAVVLHLQRQDKRVIVALENQANQLERIDAGVHAGTESLERLHQKVDALRPAEGKVPSDEELEARATDEIENCRLRSAALKDLLDQMEYAKACTFANRCFNWFERVGNALQRSFGAQAELFKRLLDEAVIRKRIASDEDEAAAESHLAHVFENAQKLLPQLDETDQLRLSSQLAHVEFVLGLGDGLSKLDGRSDVFATRRRIAILCDSDRHSEALDLLRGATSCEQWVDKGIIAATHCRQWEEAERLLSWAINEASPRIQWTCRLLFVESVLVDLVGDQGLIRSVDMTEHDRAMIERAHDLLQPLLDGVLALSRPTCERDFRVVRFGIELAIWRDSAADVDRLVRLLAQRRPFDITLGILAVRGRVAPYSDWPHRLRTEGSASFDRLYIAAALEGQNANTQPNAFRAALRLVQHAATDDERRRLHALLLELAQHLGKSALKEVEEVAPALVHPDDRQARLWRIARELSAGRPEAVTVELADLEDRTDPLWLQLQGEYLLQQGDVSQAVADLAAAALILDRIDVLEGVAGLALGHQQWDHAIQLLDRLLILRPGDLGAKAGLASALHHRHDYERAAALLTELADELPGEPEHEINAAACLVQLGRPKEAVDVLKNACQRENPPLQAVVGLAQLLVERDRPKEGFDLLRQHKERLWSRYEFVAVYWTIAFAAEEEREGHEAFVQMRTLQAEGAAPSDIVVEKSLDDMVELIKSGNQRDREMAALILQGRAPWLMVADLLNEPAYRAWNQRTSDRLWLFEDPVNLANAAIYCTNGLSVVELDGNRELRRIESTEPGRPAVIDLSALMTLQQLNLLDTAARFSSRLHVPDRYLFKMFIDSERLRPLQPSRQTVMSHLREALATRRVLVDTGESARLVLDEHYAADDAPADVYHLSDLLITLKRSGIVTDTELIQLRNVAHKPASDPQDRVPIQLGDEMRVSVSTLSTLHSCGLLDSVISHFRVFVSEEDSRAVHGEVMWFEGQTQLRAHHGDLWAFLRDCAHIERHPRERHDRDEHEEVTSGLLLDSLALASRLELPLIADDRCLQAAALNQRPQSPSSAFGTEQLLSAMVTHGYIDRDTHALSVRRLMDWRYRFLLPEADLLVYWAKRSLKSPPGPDLQAVASYWHACLRDPGLFGGMEPTQPPTTMALKYYQAIEATIGELLAGLWMDRDIPEDRARQFTSWALHYLLPDAPRVMEPRIRILGGMRHSLLLVSFFQRLVFAEDTERARRGVDVVGEWLALDPSEMVHEGTEIIHAIYKQQ